MLTQRIFPYSKLNKIENEHKNITIDNIKINKISNPIKNIINKRVLFNYKTPKKMHVLLRNKSDFSSSTTLGTSYKKSFISKNQENSLLYKLKDKITKETLILELRQELNYYIESNVVYNDFLKKIIRLKDLVKENRDKLQNNTDSFKETYKDKFNIIEQFENSIVFLGKEKTVMIEANDEILKIKQGTNNKLIKEFNEIQARNNIQKEEINSLDYKIRELEYKKSTLHDDLIKQYETDKKNYENFLKKYQILVNTYKYLSNEYDSYAKSGDEITKIDVKLDDESYAKTLLIKEDLEVKLGDRLIENSALVENMNTLKKEIKVIEDKQQEERDKREKKLLSFRLSIFNNINKTNKKRNYNFKLRNKVFRKSLSYNELRLHN
jgi:hypothetical protein